MSPGIGALARTPQVDVGVPVCRDADLDVRERRAAETCFPEGRSRRHASGRRWS